MIQDNVNIIIRVYTAYTRMNNSELEWESIMIIYIIVRHPFNHIFFVVWCPIDRIYLYIHYFLCIILYSIYTSSPFFHLKLRHPYGLGNTFALCSKSYPSAFFRCMGWVIIFYYNCMANKWRAFQIFSDYPNL
jgi:hypothetical protein